MNRNPPEMTPEMCAALLAGSYAKWQSRHHPYPVSAPDAAQDVLPMSLDRTRRVMQRADGDTAGWKHTSWCVDRMLRACKHKDRPKLFDDAVHQYCEGYGRAKKETERVSPEVGTSWVDTDIEFDPRSSTTTVTAWSAFTEVAKANADDFFELAKPINWQAGSGIFKQSAPGKWHPPTGTFLQANGRLGLNYQIFEQAEWNWSPEMAGGFVNILEITESPHDPKKFLQFRPLPEPGKFVDFGEHVLNQLFDDDLDTQRAMGPLTQELRARHVEAPTLFTEYKYDLHRSLRSRIIGGWRSGGLANDDGEYYAAWYPGKEPSAKGRGLLCIQIRKVLRFSRQVDVFEDYSNLLNLMAPALGSLLLEQLAHDGILPVLRSAGTSSTTTKSVRATS